MSSSPQATCIILITGANRGLGFATCHALAGNPSNHIIIGSRIQSNGEQSLEQLRRDGKASFSAIDIDVTSLESVRTGAQTVESIHGKLDILINNAGVSNQESDLATSIAANTATNTSGAARVTDAFLPLLLKAPSPRLLFVSTVLGSLEAKADATHPYSSLPFWGYRASKAALNMIMLCYHTELKDRVKVFGVCPGFLATDFAGPANEMRKMGAIEADEGAKVVRQVVEGERDADVGRVVAAAGTRPW